MTPLFSAAWKYSRSGWTQLGTTIFSWECPCPWQGVGPDGFQKLLLTQTGFCDLPGTDREWFKTASAKVQTGHEEEFIYRDVGQALELGNASSLCLKAIWIKSLIML